MKQLRFTRTALYDMNMQRVVWRSLMPVRTSSIAGASATSIIYSRLWMITAVCSSHTAYRLHIVQSDPWS